MKLERQLTINTTNLEWSAGSFEAELHSILQWWLNNMIDENRGGFIGRIDGRGNKYPKAEKGLILNTRLLWTFSVAAKRCNNIAYRQAAHRAFQYLNNHFLDVANGGYYWMVDYLGQPTDFKKQIYGQAFAIYALGAYYELSTDERAADLAIELIWLIEKYSYDNLNGGYRSVFEEGWSQAKDMRLSAKDVDESKIMNTHLHILEAYASFYRVRPFPTLKTALIRVLGLFEQYFCRPNGSLQIYFDDHWNPVGDHTSFGHDIEASWLLYEAAVLVQEEISILKWKNICLHLAQKVLENGLGDRGALAYEANAAGIVIYDDRHWWTQAEAVVGFWNAFELSADPQYRDAAFSILKYINQHLKDQQNGEWHWRVTVKDQPVYTENKAGPWKAPYHNGRMCLEMMQRLAHYRDPAFKS